MNRYRNWNLAKAPIAVTAFSLAAYGIAWRVLQADRNPHPRTGAFGLLMVLLLFLLALMIPTLLAGPDSLSPDPRRRSRPWIKVLALLAAAAAIGLLPLRDAGRAGPNSEALAWGIVGYGVAVLAAFEGARQAGAGLLGAQAVATALALAWTATPFWVSSLLELAGDRPGPQAWIMSNLINRNPFLVFAYYGAGIDVLRQSDLYSEVLGQLHYSYARPAEMGRFHLLAALALAVPAFAIRGLREALARPPKAAAAPPAPAPPPSAPAPHA